jgi:hypothetical protein
MRTRSPGNVIDLKSVFPLRRDGAIVFEECLDRSLIDPKNESGLSERGEAIARGKAKHRTPRAKAQALLEDFLQRIDKLNHDPDGVRYIEEVWLFGSMMRGEDTVGDIDMALLSDRRPEYRTDHDFRRKHLDKLLSRYDDAPATRPIYWSAEEWITGRSLYGAKRHPLLAGVQNGTDDLAGLGVPCQLMYDRKRGGRVDDPILPRHPQSNGRRNDTPPQAEMPELTPCDIRPMDARWITGFHDWGDVSPYYIFRGWTDDAHKLFPHYPERLRVVADDYKLDNYCWIPKRLKAGGIDGRNMIALIDATPFWGTSIILRRRIEASPTNWILHAEFESLELHRARKRIDLGTLPDMAAATALILAVDAERMLRRANEETISPTVQIKIGRSGLNDDMNAYFIDVIRDHLLLRTIRIEPEGWMGAPALIACD